eukprot:GAFH01000548.1.p4 GENE.GAFH01000548.1~~GAFH01000548.1.p4  ORF type:complete len:65 (+),score=15.95 GAFH01000548.1:78-272(+)
MKIRSLVLDCPLLETLMMSRTGLAAVERFELAGPVPPHLRPQCPAGWEFDELAKRFPWLRPRTP